MGISGYLPSSRISQSGVCTSSTRPASPYEGQVVYETDTNQVRVYDGSAWVMIADTDTPPGLETITPTSVTNGSIISGTSSATANSAVSSIVLNGVFSSTYESYRIVISNLTTSNTTSGMNLYAKMHDGTNPASTNYNWAFARIDIAASTVAGSSVALGTLGVIVGLGTGDKFGTAFDVVNPQIATHTIFPQISGVNVSTGYMYQGAGMHQNSTAYTGIQFAPSTGTITGGTFTVFGYRK